MAAGRRKGRPPRQLKDRVLHARIPEQLDRELRHRAGRLGLSVSTVVRNVLLHTFDLVEGIVTDSADVSRVLRGREPRASSDAPPAPVTQDASVLGWQELTLAVNAVCAQCNAILRQGMRAAIGVPTGVRPAFLCTACFDRLQEASQADAGPRSGGTALRDASHPSFRRPPSGS